jgi:sulfhydrogenase subunit delta
VAQLQPLSKYVHVDAAITGCPIEKHELLDALANLLRGQLPVVPQYAVCAECKARENECLLVGRDAFCCGPVTVAGCHARCISLGVPCIGCRGPVSGANYASAAGMYAQKGYCEQDIKARLNWFATGVA